jgi:hypothetical protein
MQTELEAVNEMLAKIREAPVNTLQDPLPEEAGLALARLRRVSRDVQSTGWRFNTELDVTLTPAVDTTITLSDDILKIDWDVWTNPTTMDPELRGNRVFDRLTAGYTFTTAPVAKRLTRLLAWSDLPEMARIYITKRAAREFAADMVNGQQSNMGSATVEEQRAFVELRRTYAVNLKANFLDSPGVREVAWRNGWRQ